MQVEIPGLAGATGGAGQPPSRAAWQKPDRVVAALGLRWRQVVGEIGAGPGYFTLRLARAVGPSGHVYAVDPEPGVLEALRGRLAQARVHNASCARSPRVERASLPSAPIFSRAGPEDIVARDARIDFRLNVLERKCRVRRDPRSEK